MTLAGWALEMARRAAGAVVAVIRKPGTPADRFYQATVQWDRPG